MNNDQIARLFITVVVFLVFLVPPIIYQFGKIEGHLEGKESALSLRGAAWELGFKTGECKEHCARFNMEYSYGEKCHCLAPAYPH